MSQNIAGQVIRHSDVPVGTEFYFGWGRKCHNCPCFFMNSYDLGKHQPVCRELRDERMGWRKGFGDRSWFIPVDRDPELVQIIKRNGGHVLMESHKYRISKNGKWITKEEVGFM